MSFPSNLSLGELTRILHVVQTSLSIRSHYDLLNWMQDDVQAFLPHEIVVAAWGDFSLGLGCYDVVSAIPGLRTESIADDSIQPFVNSLYKRWMVSGNAPYLVTSHQGFEFSGVNNAQALNAMRRMTSALIHGIKDHRGRHDCLYVFMGRPPTQPERSRDTLRFLLPYIDAAFRQVAHLPDQYLAGEGGRPSTLLSMQTEHPSLDTGLSARELDIMEWVRKGKTNQEIGMILDISAFTVKNHVQRIFKKLDVVNRAQAVAKMEAMRSGIRL